MSQENVEVIEAHLKALSHKGLDAWLGYFADDIDYRAVEDTVDYPGPIHDKAALRAYAQDWFAMFHDLSIEAVELIEVGDDEVIGVLRVSGQAKASGVEADLTYAVRYMIRGGKIARADEYRTRYEAVEAAGLSE